MSPDDLPPRIDEDKTDLAATQESEKPLTYADLSRRDIRSLIFHLLYTAESLDYQDSLAVIVHNYQRGFDIEIPVDSEVFTTVQSIIDQKDELDKAYSSFLTNWKFERVGTSAKLILRFAIWEMRNTTVDFRIIMNEAIELAKCFAEDDAFRFINGILDRIVQSKSKN